MKNISKFAILVSGAFLVATGCIKETFPTSYATKEQVGQSSSALEAMVSAIPAQMVEAYVGLGGRDSNDYDFGYPSMMIMTDSNTGDIVVCNNANYDWFSQWGTNESPFGENYQAVYIAWRTWYMFIKSCNDVISSINPESATPEQLTYLGRALAVRAFCYLNIAQIYEYKTPTDPGIRADYKPENDIVGLTVPIITETTTQDQGKANPRAKVNDIYAFIFQDLDAAENYLKNATLKGRLLPTLEVVYGLKARAYMAQGSAGVAGAFAQAATYARLAIDTFGGSPLTQAQWENPTTGFNNYSANSNSWMWYLAYSADNMGNLANYCAHMTNEEMWTNYGSGVQRGVSKLLYDQIPDTDWRKHSWLDPSGSDYYNYKLNRDITSAGKRALKPYANLKIRPAAGNCDDYKVGGASEVCVMRVEEMMYIEAEALAMSGNLGEAKTKLAALVKTRDASYSCDAIASADDFQKEVFFQKRVEFWGEGIVFFDFKRLAAGVTVGYPGTNVQEGYRYNVTGIAPWWNWPIPRREINGNPVLEGYNNPDPTKSVKEWKDNNS